MTDTAKPGKGEYQGSCNRSACQRPGAEWWNRSTRAYYCYSCAWSINQINGEELCTMGEHEDAGEEAANLPKPAKSRAQAYLDGDAVSVPLSFEVARDAVRLEAENERLTQERDALQARDMVSLDTYRDAMISFADAYNALFQAAQEARAGHSARLFGMLDELKGTDQ